MSLFCAKSAGLQGTALGRRNGQVAVFGALALTLMFGAVGLSVDFGWEYFLKQRVQTAADAAATAAAVYALNNADTCTTVTCGVALSCAGITAPPTSSLKAGCLYATVDGPPVVTASMIENDSTHLPAGLTGVAPSIWVKATVTVSSPVSFLYIWGFKNATISSSSIAGVNSVPATSCIYVLDPNASGALTMTGTANVTTTNCAIYVDSSSATALTKKGSGDINGTVNIVGNYSQVGSGSITPAPATGKPTTADPLSSLPAPPFAGCDHTNYSTSATVTLDHGVYCGGISITGSGTITLNPGNYIMNGGGFSAAGSANITGAGVMIYNTATAGHTIGSISVSGSGTYTLSAPTAGVYEGILMFQDRTQSIGADVEGSNTSTMVGTLYLPDASLKYAGSATAQYTAIVSDTLTMVGSSAFKSDTNGTYTGISMAKPVLLQ
jgi:hypothetical protein